MRWLIERIRSLSRHVGEWWGGNDTSLSEHEDRYNSSEERNSILNQIGDTGGVRTRTTFLIGSTASSDSISSEKDTLEYIDDDAIQTIATFHQLRRCSCGCLLSQGNMALGTCGVCGEVVCAAAGCAARCEKCGKIVCTKHTARFGEKHVLCSKHRYLGYWYSFWEI